MWESVSEFSKKTSRTGCLDVFFDTEDYDCNIFYAAGGKI
jgi:hypothetical protein